MTLALSQQSLLSALCRLAGLVHDLGKVNAQFQRSLTGTPELQRLRHDVLGALMFKQACKLATAGATPSDDTWLSKGAADCKAFFAAVTNGGQLALPELQAEPAGPTSEGLYGPSLGRFLLQPQARAKVPLLQAVYFLVLTHHHLIRKDKTLTVPSLWRHVHDSVEWSRDNVQMAGTTPWECPRWQTAFQSAAQEVLAIARQQPDLVSALASSPKTYVAALTQVLRPALIIADQATSTMQADVLARHGQSAAFETGTLYANSTAQGEAGDTLSTHLTNAGTRSAAMVDMLLAPQDGAFTSAMPAAADGQLNAQPPSASTGTPATWPFQWQCDAQHAVEACQGIERQPFFGAVLSAPGSGKTAGGPRILRAASGGNLRFTLAVGRRSLTRQSGEAYRQRLGFAASDVAVMVGESGAALLDAASAASESSESAQGTANQQKGSECLKDDTVFVMEQEQALTGVARGTWLDSVQPAEQVTRAGGFLNNKRIELIDAPILVATVDHLVGAASLTRTSDASLMLRIANSDLILDELDDFGAEDLVTLGKLVHLYGVYGRRVLLMSGTLNDFLVAQMYDFWRKGVEVHEKLQGKSLQPVCALFSNLTTPRVLQEGQGLDLPLEIADFTADFAQQLRAAPSKNRARVLPLFPAPEGATPTWPAQVFDAALVQHQVHASVQAGTGVAVSSGVVRFNSVSHAQAFARHLYSRDAQPGEPLVRVVCYHARYPVLIRALIERALDQMLHRDAAMLPEGKTFPAHAALDKAVAQAQLEGAPGVMVIVATTSIEEVGRDHDFDYAMTEPHSERSLAQLAGRVRRHRASTAAHANVSVFSTTVNALEGKGLPYGQSGVQGANFRNGHHWLVLSPAAKSPLCIALQRGGLAGGAQAQLEEGAHESAMTLLASELLPLQEFEQSVTPALTLSAPKVYAARRLGMLEHLEMRATLDASAVLEGSPPSLREALASAESAMPLALTTIHAELFQFRQDSGQSAELQMTEKSGRIEFLREGVPAIHQGDAPKWPERELLGLGQAWREALEQFCAQTGWTRESALSALGAGACQWSERAEKWFLSQRACIRFGVCFGFSALAG